MKQTLVLKKHGTDLTIIASDGIRKNDPSDFEIMFPIGDGKFQPVLPFGKPYSSYAEAEEALYRTGFEVGNDPRLQAMIEHYIAAGIVEAVSQENCASRQ